VHAVSKSQSNSLIGDIVVGVVSGGEIVVFSILKLGSALAGVRVQLSEFNTRSSIATSLKI
jgi:hypothetical protein